MLFTTIVMAALVGLTVLAQYAASLERRTGSVLAF
jgi:hypothetical protein